jgi:eukaryotic-like serine/threonine-protein kinase
MTAITTRKVRRPEPLVNQTRSDAPPLLDLSPGDVLGTFKIERRLGKGGMSSVFLARHVTGGARVAIKVPNPELAHDPDACDRLATEGKVLARLRHPNVVTLFDSAVTPAGVPYLVMEYLDGQPLSAREHTQMAIQPVVHVLSHLCDALAAFHATGGVHRDVKPENVFLIRRLDAPMTVKLLDFGIARVRGEVQRQRATAMGVVVGTPDYMAPEQMMGELLDERVDLYAVGVIGYQLLTGELPFKSFRQKMFEQVPSIRERRNDVPVALEGLLCRALAADPVHRFVSAAEMREELGAVLGARKSAPSAANLGAVSAAKPISVMDQAGTELASCTGALVVPGGAWLCTRGVIPTREVQVLLAVPGHEAFIPARIVSSAAFPAHIKSSLPRGFLVEFARLESSARVALQALAPK